MKNLLLKIPYFRKRQESFDKAEQEAAKYLAEHLAEKEKYRLWEERMDARDAETARLEEIRENLLDAQKIKRLRMSRQTF